MQITKKRKRWKLMEVSLCLSFLNSFCWSFYNSLLKECLVLQKSIFFGYVCNFVGLLVCSLGWQEKLSQERSWEGALYSPSFSVLAVVSPSGMATHRLTRGLWIFCGGCKIHYTVVSSFKFGIGGVLTRIRSGQTRPIYIKICADRKLIPFVFGWRISNQIWSKFRSKLSNLH